MPVDLDFYSMLGIFGSFMAMSDKHRQMDVNTYVRAELVPALEHGHVRVVWGTGNRPLAFIVYALLSRERLVETLRNNGTVAEGDWNCGEHYFVNEFLTNGIDGKDAIMELRNDLFAGTAAVSVKRNRDAKVTGVRILRGKEFSLAGIRFYRDVIEEALPAGPKVSISAPGV